MSNSSFLFFLPAFCKCLLYIYQPQLWLHYSLSSTHQQKRSFLNRKLEYVAPLLQTLQRPSFSLRVEAEVLTGSARPHTACCPRTSLSSAQPLSPWLTLPSSHRPPDYSWTGQASFGLRAFVLAILSAQMLLPKMSAWLISLPPENLYSNGNPHTRLSLTTL